MLWSTKVAIALAIFSLTGCASNPWNVQHLLLSSGAYAPQTPPDKIQIYRGRGEAPSRPHVDIAQISVREKPLHVPSTEQFSFESAMNQLKSRASDLGADAVKEVSIYVAPTGTVGAGSVSVDGVAIRWK